MANGNGFANRRELLSIWAERCFIFGVMLRIFRAVLRLALAITLTYGVAMGVEPVPSRSQPVPCLVYIGTYTRGGSKGIYMSWLNTDTGAMTSPVLAAETTNPAFLALHPNHHFLYAVGEFDSSTAASNGVVSAFAIDATTRKLTLLNQQASGGHGPCHLAVDKTGKCVLVANYNSGSIAAFPIQADGSLGSATTTIQHHGASVHPSQQQNPHAHAVGFDLANQRAFCADLGIDKILVYRFDPTKNTITPNAPPFAVLKPGSGPRHFAMDPSGRQLYIINELNSTVAAFNYEAATGVLRGFQTISTLPDGFTGTNTASEIAVHPTGRFVYAGNRGHNSIAVYGVDGFAGYVTVSEDEKKIATYPVDDTTGRLTLIQHQSTLGKTPRNFAIDPTGKYLLAANQDSNTIVVFRIDSQTGRLTPTGQTIEIPVPTCVMFLPT